MPEKPIAVAMSGGVDSSVVAGLLRREGHEVVGLTMQLWNQRRLPELASENATGRCCSLDDVYDARAVAGHLGIPYYVVNFEDRFEKTVVEPFVESYLKGDTPIPCTLCNNFVKFDQFLEMADAAGAEKIATGHYARLWFDEKSGRYQMARSADTSKDQTYFLWGLTQPQLARAMFPLGGMVKSDVRRLAEELGLPVAEKPDSQEICFVPNGDYAAFIDAYLKDRGVPRETVQGEIVSTAGTPLGRHEGAHRFTVGQRRGVGIAAGEPLYVISTNPATQTVVVGRNEDLLRGHCTAREVNWVSIAEPAAPIRASVRIRNRHTPAPATITALAGNRAEVRFDEPQRAVTPGQAAVFYHPSANGDLVLGGGWIE
ncbi:MAG: tRNA 2-thiouridine(34) synthase MnmA [Bryobacteraceae bacterium]|nr:tRNA 2-thiouridine(34) synthase MnmA [Bryobacteraceae bacterium]